MNVIGELLLLATNVYTFVIIANVVISWLIAFGVLNTNNPQAGRLVEGLNRLTEPVMAPIRRFIPSIGGIDISPIIVIFGIMLLQRIIITIFF